MNKMEALGVAVNPCNQVFAREWKIIVPTSNEKSCLAWTYFQILVYELTIDVVFCAH